MRWNYRSEHGKKLLNLMKEGLAPWSDGYFTSDEDVRQVYNDYTEFNKNYTLKQFYPGYRRIARDYKADQSKAGRRRREVDNSLRGDGRGGRLGKGSTNVRGQGGSIQTRGGRRNSDVYQGAADGIDSTAHSKGKMN